MELVVPWLEPAAIKHFLSVFTSMAGLWATLLILVGLIPFTRYLVSRLGTVARRWYLPFARANPNPVMKVDAAGSILYGNPAAQGLSRRTGLRPDELLPVAHLKFVERCLRTKTSSQTELALGPRSFQVAYAPFKDEAAVLITWTDVTARHSSARRTTLLSKLPEANPLAVLVVEVGTGRVHYENPSATRLRQALGSKTTASLIRAAVADCQRGIEMAVRSGGDRQLLLYGQAFVSDAEMVMVSVVDLTRYSGSEVEVGASQPLEVPLQS